MDNMSQWFTFLLKVMPFIHCDSNRGIGCDTVSSLSRERLRRQDSAVSFNSLCYREDCNTVRSSLCWSKHSLKSVSTFRSDEDHGV